MQKNFFEILVQTALTVGLFWTILKLTPKSALLSFTILYVKAKILKNMHKKILKVGLFWTILKLTPKSTLLSFTIL